jgi:hypothetical protein
MEATMLRDPDVVLSAYCQMRGIGREVLIGQGKAPAMVWPRHEAVWLLRHLTGLSLAQLGEVFGQRDPTTMMNSVNRVADRIAEDSDYRVAMLQLLEAVASYETAGEVGALEAATSIVRRAVNEPAGRNSGVEVLGLAMLTVASVLHSVELTDAEARAAAIQLISGHGGGHVPRQ